MIRTFLFLVSFSFAVISCKSDKPADTAKPEAEAESKEEILNSLKGIEENLIEAFWIASDETLRENTELDGHHQKKEDFVKEHVVALHSLAPHEDGKKQKATFRITIPELKNAFYEFVFLGDASGWEAVDARTQAYSAGQPFNQNYFSGKFLGKKSLKPYLEKALDSMQQKKTAK